MEKQSCRLKYCTTVTQRVVLKVPRMSSESELEASSTLPRGLHDSVYMSLLNCYCTVLC